MDVRDAAYGGGTRCHRCQQSASILTGTNSTHTSDQNQLAVVRCVNGCTQTPLPPVMSLCIRLCNTSELRLDLSVLSPSITSIRPQRSCSHLTHSCACSAPPPQYRAWWKDRYGKNSINDDEEVKNLLTQKSSSSSSSSSNGTITTSISPALGAGGT